MIYKTRISVSLRSRGPSSADLSISFLKQKISMSDSKDQSRDDNS